MAEEGEPAMVTVPEGHSVTVLSLSPAPTIAPTDFGVVVVDFGPTDGPTTATVLERAAALPAEATILWIVQAAVVGGWASSAADHRAAFVQALSARQAARPGSQVIVLGTHDGDDAVLAAARQIGVGVHRPHEDGAALVAVRKPDGSVTIGMPGPPA